MDNRYGYAGPLAIPEGTAPALPPPSSRYGPAGQTCLSQILPIRNNTGDNRLSGWPALLHASAWKRLGLGGSGTTAPGGSVAWRIAAAPLAEEAVPIQL